MMFVTITLLNKAAQSLGFSLKPTLGSNEGGNTKKKKKCARFYAQPAIRAAVSALFSIRPQPFAVIMVALP